MDCNSSGYEYTKKILRELFDIDIDTYSIKVQKGLIDVEINHNRSWAKDLYEKNKDNLDAIALLYRGTKITFREMFENASKYASALSRKGVTKGVEVPVFMSPCPEFVYTIMAINLLEAKINSYGAFDIDYVNKIIEGCDTNFVICSDDNYGKFKELFENAKIDEIVMFSLTDSLKNSKDPYIELDRQFYDFENKIELYKSNDKRIISKQDFLNEVNAIKDISDYANGDINSEFLITYSGGTTSNRPKAIVHTNRSLILMGRFQDPDLADLPPTNGLIGEMIIPTFSNTSIITSMSDVLYKKCTVALEPIYHREFLLYSLAINKPNFIAVPRNMLVDAAKKLYKDERFKNFTMPYMMILTSVGESTSKGEEKFINKMLRKAKCGVDKLPWPLAPVPISIGGGDCERGGMFFTAFRSLQDLHPKYKLTGLNCGLNKYAMVQTAILDENGARLSSGKVGLLGTKTPTTMKCYKNDPEATKKSKIKDSFGEIWNNCNVYAMNEKHGTLVIFGRIGNELILDNGNKIPLFLIGLEVERDTKHVLSYEVINIDNTAVVHVEFMPAAPQNKEKILMGIENRIIRKLGKEVADKVLYRVRTFEEGFIGTKSEKRNSRVLMSEGITDKCVKPIYEDGQIKLLSSNMVEKIKVYKKN